ncbi:MAG: class I SAM-dependent methyltransferase [Acidobacteria bacterium]|nr:class I SAM-dependent methyltransferase [Acidobacteriota bacterium]
MAGATRALTDLFSLFGARRPSETTSPGASELVLAQEPHHATKALGRFLRYLQARDGPTLIDLGPVVGSNLTFFGEQLGCRIRVEDLFVDLERHAKDGTLDELPKFLGDRFPQPPETVDGILCWDVFDFLDRRSADALATVLTRMLRPDGALLGFFNTGELRAQVYTKSATSSSCSKDCASPIRSC